MKAIFAWLLMAGIVMADGVVLYERATGKVVEKKIPVVLFKADNGMIYDVPKTNWILAWSKLQPKETVPSPDGRRVLGKQIFKGDVPTNGVDWSVYDLADYTAAPENPTTTNDLSGVVARNITLDGVLLSSCDYDTWSTRERKMLSLIVKEINILRVREGLPERTKAQVIQALKSE